MNEIDKFKIMKRITLSLVTLFQAVITFAQYNPIMIPRGMNVLDFTVIDTGNIKIWYTMNADETNPDKRSACEDLQVLETGKNFSRYYSYPVFQSDSLTAIENKKLEKANAGVRLNTKLEDESGVFCFFIYYKDYANNILTEYARMPRGIHGCYCLEDIPVQDWQLFDDTLTVGGYLCQKAECRFRGRSYTAWFTPDIPINNGPWKFGGLPGLILKVYDSERKFVFEYAGLESDRQFPIKKFKDLENYNEVPRTAVLEWLRKIDKDYYAAVGIVFTSRTNNKPKRPLYKVMLLELE
jgi:GLPGLI family protein